MISARNVEKIYPGAVPTPALRNVSFEVAKGEFLIISGRSGSGKSTLLHQLGLLDTPTAGSITIDGIDVLALSEEHKTRFRLERLGYVFQEYALIGEFTALQNVYLPAMALGVLPSAYLERARALLESVGLGARINHRPDEMSGGEQQRVAIARALINGPAVLFADEPTANLDRASSHTVLELFASLSVHWGQTIVLVTHEPDEARPYANRVLWLTDGQIEHVEELRAPSTP
jgi:putative ABC transport system ATP-binding protein